MSKTPGVILDRDGTLIVDLIYLNDPAKIDFTRTLAAVARNDAHNLLVQVACVAVLHHAHGTLRQKLTSCDKNAQLKSVPGVGGAQIGMGFFYDGPGF